MKKLLSLCLVFVLAITFSASSFGGYYEGDTPKDPIQSSSAHDDYEPFINTGAIPATPAERAETALDAMRPRQHSAFYRANLPRSVQGWYNVPDMTYYAQETDYTCGAASLRMALDYFNGINYSESSIYSGANGTSGVGLTQSQVRTYINKKQSKYDYTGYDEQTQDNATITKILYTSIANEQVPPILGVKEVKVPVGPSIYPHTL